MRTAKAAGAVVSFDLNYRARLWQAFGGRERARDGGGQGHAVAHQAGHANVRNPGVRHRGAGEAGGDLLRVANERRVRGVGPAGLEFERGLDRAVGRDLADDLQRRRVAGTWRSSASRLTLNSSGPPSAGVAGS